MMKKVQLIVWVLLSGLVMIPLAGFAQRPNPMFAIASDLYSNEAVNVFDLRSKDPINSTYWLDDWYSGEIIVQGGTKIDNYLFKYDVVNHNLDLKYNDSVKVLPGNLVKEFYINSKNGKLHFVDLNKHMGIQEYQLGFFELVHEGDVTLVSKMETQLLRANYLPTHDSGNVNDSFVKFETHFFILNGEIIRIPKKKKEAMSLMERLKPGGGDFMKSQKLKSRNRADLLKMVDYLNES